MQERFLDRVFAVDEFGLLGVRHAAGSCWAEQGHSERHPATYDRARSHEPFCEPVSP